MSYSFDSIKKIIEKECSEPKDINKDNILWTKAPHDPVVFLSMDPEEKQAYEDKKINSLPYYGKKVGGKRVVKKGVDWDIDVKNTSFGYFDKKGQFIKGNGGGDRDIMWIVKDDNNKIDGPYKSKEMKDLENNNFFENKFLRRATDKIFVPYEKLKEVTDRFSLDAKLSHLFIEEKKKEKRKEKVVESVEETDISKNLDECIKTKKLLAKMKLEGSIKNIYDKITNKSKKEASSALKKDYKLIQQDVDEVLNTFLKEIKFKVCTDVDENGFLIVGKKEGRKK